MFKQKKYQIILFLVGFIHVTIYPVSKLAAQKKVLYVAVNGSDKNVGSEAQPFATLTKAKDVAEKLSKTTAVTVWLKDDIYYLPQTLKITTAASFPITFQAVNEGKAVVSGGKTLKLQWQPYQNNIWVANCSEDAFIDQLIVNGKRQRMARYPNAVANKNVFDYWTLSHAPKADTANDVLAASRLAKWNNVEGGYLNGMQNLLWGDMHWIIKGKKENGSLITEGGWQNNRPSIIHSVYRFVENIFEELDAPGEWYFHPQEHKMYYIPETNVDLNKATVEIVRLKHLVEVVGSAKQFVKNIHFKGLVFKHTARTFMENKEPLLRSDWTVYRGGAILFNNAVNCSITDCEFDQVGGNTIFVNGYNDGITIKGCYIHQSGASGILFVGDTSAVFNPLTGYVKQDYDKLNTTPGARNNQYPRNCLVEDCLITKTGRDEKQSAPIHISIAEKIHVNHCSIYDVPRAGININDGSFGGHIIENCDIFNTVLETGDHGSFNSWGRDRYWTPNVKDIVAAVKKNSSLPFLDVQSPNIIAHNRWRCDHGWDIDLDDGSSRYLIYNNLLLNGGLKLREGYQRIATNNITVNNSLHPHVWLDNSGDVFKHNIIFAAYKPAAMTRTLAADAKWGQQVDSNFFFTDTAKMYQFKKNACDTNSLSGDPLFENPTVGNYTVKPNSPALQMGFKNFAMDDFGVTKPALKAIAKQPVFPVIKASLVSTTNKANRYIWMGTTLKEPKGDELSAYGVGYDEGGVALENIIANTKAAQFGFKDGDLILKINNANIKSINQLIAFVKDSQKGSFNVTIIRNQLPTSVIINEMIAVQ